MRRLWIFALVAGMVACNKADDDLAPAQAASIPQPMTQQELVDDLKLYIQDRIAHYHLHPVTSVNLVNTDNPHNHVGEGHNALLEEMHTTHAAFLASTASFTASDCYPSTCPVVTVGAEHRPLYAALDSYDALYGAQASYDFLNRVTAQSTFNAYEAQANVTFTGAAPASFSEADYQDVLTAGGVTGLVNAVLAASLAEMTVANDIETFVALCNDVEDYIVSSPGISGTDQSAVLCGLTTAKHSASYWEDEHTSSGPPPHDFALKLPRWVNVLVADVVGGVVGHAAGGTVGGVILGAALSYAMEDALG